MSIRQIFTIAIGGALFIGASLAFAAFALAAHH